MRRFIPVIGLILIAGCEERGKEQASSKSEPPAKEAAGSNTGWRRHSSPTGEYSIETPSDWVPRHKGSMLAVVSPDGQVSVNSTTYRKPDTSLAEFATQRFGTVEEWYKPVRASRRVQQITWDGIVQEFSGTWPGEKEPTGYIVLAANRGEWFVSIAITLGPRDYELHRELYDRILESLRFQHS